MARFTPEEHKKRKDATRVNFEIKRAEADVIDPKTKKVLVKKGEILNPEVVSLTVQGSEHVDACDVNKVVNRAFKNGQVDLAQVPKSNRVPTFGDFTGVTTYQDACNRVVKMNNEFMALDPKIRLQFDNDPQKLVDFLSKPENREEAIKLGLLPKPVVKHSKIETPEGQFWVTTKDGVEIGREKVKAVAPTPGA